MNPSSQRSRLILTGWINSRFYFLSSLADNVGCFHATGAWAPPSYLLLGPPPIVLTDTTPYTTTTETACKKVGNTQKSPGLFSDGSSPNKLFPPGILLLLNLYRTCWKASGPAGSRVRSPMPRSQGSGHTYLHNGKALISCC